MCGRFTLRARLNDILAEFALEAALERADQDAVASFFPEYRPRYNIAPTQQIAAVRQATDGKREFVSLKWGLIPSWAKDEKIAYSTINARAETVAEKPAFRSAFKRRRCVIVADGWYEWQATGPKTKQPYRMHYRDDRPFGMAGLWEKWTQAEKTIESCTIIVTSAAVHLASLHDRSPCIIRPADYAAWLDPEFESRPVLEAMLRPPDESIEAYPVSPKVGSVKNQGPELAERVETC